ncbi:GAF domain-containing protein [Oleiharenicola lentus]|uniref:histidine kinase n=1 Tax=Oleiharenicola lentus TaxID=2508720 RepID=A0A4Q1C9S5_9BACT|nr:GAF domain-containing sensor histidine kinase [Oleiharenicola lentus]RXK55591.1 GAF domain-containing protein [Oleiharenicola lentus]
MAEFDPQSAPAKRQSDAAAHHALASLAVTAPNAISAQEGVLAAIMSAFPADSGSLSLLTPESASLEICAQQGLPPETGEFALRPGQGITGWVALHARPLLVADVSHEPRYIAARRGVCSEMAAPIIVEGQVVGVVNLDADQPGAFNSTDLDRLQSFADEAGRVLNRLWQFDRMRANSTQLTTLVELGHALVAQLAPEELLNTITDSARALFNARLSLLHDYDDASRELKLHSWSAAGDLAATGLSLQQQTVPIDEALFASALRTGRATEYQHLDGARYREAADLPRDPSLCSALASPLILEDKPAGILSVFHDHPHRFSDDEKRLFTALANFATVALHNARLYSRVFHSEEVLRKNETLTTLGLLAAEIAHEIRNPLTVIKLLHGPLGADFAPADPRRKDLQIITEKIEQLEGLVTRVLSFARAPASLHSRWSLDEILSDTNHLLRAKLAQAGVELHYTPPAGAVAVDVNKGQIQQVFLNLALNAFHAMPQGGELRITCATEGANVLIDVSDTGGGIPPEVQPRIFESFLSTRAGGTGLGLTIALRIVKDHHGSLQLRSTGPRGTTMRVTLPIAQG